MAADAPFDDAPPIHRCAAEICAAVLRDDAAAVSDVMCADGAALADAVRFALNNDGWLVQHYAAANNAYAVVQWLLQEGCADLDATAGPASWTPLHFAAYNGHAQLCALLRMHGVQLDASDRYGDTPGEVATAVGHAAVADGLGDVEALRQAQRYQRRLRQEELEEERRREKERAEAEQQREDQDRRRNAALRRRTERLRRQSEAQAAQESSRQVLFIEWLRKSEEIARDAARRLEFLLYMRLQVHAEGAALEAAAAEAVRNAEAAAQLHAGARRQSRRRSSRGRSSPKRRSVASRRSAGSVDSGMSDELLLAGAARPMEQWDVLDFREPDYSDLEVPPLTGVVSRDRRKEHNRAKKKAEAFKVARKEAALAHHGEFVEQCHVEYRDLGELERGSRERIFLSWLTQLAGLQQANDFKDRHHVGDFVAHSSPVCECGYPCCTPGAVVWTCCGSTVPESQGCAAMPDRSRPKKHPGTFQFHPEGCTCAEIPFDDDDIPRRFSLTQARRGAGGPLRRRSTTSSLLGPLHDPQRGGRNRFCNPGGFVWTCCGSSVPESDGCTLRKRYLAAPNDLLHPTAAAVVQGSSLGFDHVTLETTTEHNETVIDVVNAAVPHHATPSRVTVALELPPAEAALLGPTQAPFGCVVCFEVRVVALPVAEINAERAVVGVVATSTAASAGAFITGDHGAGWWAGTREVRGFGAAKEAAEPYEAGDLIAVVVDRANHEVVFYRNRRFAAALKCDTRTATLRPAFTVVAGAHFRVEVQHLRRRLGYVADHMFRRWGLGRGRRLCGSEERYHRLFPEAMRATAPAGDEPAAASTAAESPLDLPLLSADRQPSSSASSGLQSPGVALPPLPVQAKRRSTTRQLPTFVLGE